MTWMLQINTQVPLPPPFEIRVSLELAQKQRVLSYHELLLTTVIAGGLRLKMEDYPPIALQGHLKEIRMPSS